MTMPKAIWPLLFIRSSLPGSCTISPRRQIPVRQIRRSHGNLRGIVL